mmetsp:Transcript_1178/g.3330  ORF Transcript_1178/g.3330 Transcript_1178/m.3330 type:complete len:810 (+) Transcript_1178:58-2487(+)
MILSSRALHTRPPTFSPPCIRRAVPVRLLQVKHRTKLATEHEGLIKPGCVANKATNTAREPLINRRRSRPVATDAQQKQSLTGILAEAADLAAGGLKAGTRRHAGSVAGCLRSLAYAAVVRPDGRVSTAEQRQVAATVQRLAASLLVPAVAPRGADPGPTALHLLSGKQLSYAAWAASKLAEVPGVQVQPLCQAIAGIAAEGADMGPRDQLWKHWAMLLCAMAVVELNCENTPALQKAFARAVPQVLSQGIYARVPAQSIANILYAAGDCGADSSTLRPLVDALDAAVIAGGVMQKSVAQDWSHCMWGCAKLGIVRPRFFQHALQELKVMVVNNQRHMTLNYSAAIYSSAIAGLDARAAKPFLDALEREAPRIMHDLDAQAWSNLLWGLAEMKAYMPGLISMGAHAMADRVHSLNMQQLANTLWALSTLGWYEPAVYESLVAQVVLLARDESSYERSVGLGSAVLACAEVLHGGPALQHLARSCQFDSINPQAMGNALYAWALMRSAPTLSTAADTWAVWDPAVLALVDRLAQLHTGSSALAEDSVEGQIMLRQLGLCLQEMKWIGQERQKLPGWLTGAIVRAATGQCKVLAARHQDKPVNASVVAACAATWPGCSVQMGAALSEREAIVASAVLEHPDSPHQIAVAVADDTFVLRHPLCRLRGVGMRWVSQLRREASAVVLVRVPEGDVTEAVLQQATQLTQQALDVLKHLPAGSAAGSSSRRSSSQRRRSQGLAVAPPRSTTWPRPWWRACLQAGRAWRGSARCAASWCATCAPCSWTCCPTTCPTWTGRHCLASGRSTSSRSPPTL